VNPREVIGWKGTPDSGNVRILENLEITLAGQGGVRRQQHEGGRAVAGDDRGHIHLGCKFLSQTKTPHTAAGKFDNTRINEDAEATTAWWSGGSVRGGMCNNIKWGGRALLLRVSRIGVDSIGWSHTR